jgi:hypothetical protein
MTSPSMFQLQIGGLVIGRGAVKREGLGSFSRREKSVAGACGQKKEDVAVDGVIAHGARQHRR